MNSLALVDVADWLAQQDARIKNVDAVGKALRAGADEVEAHDRARRGDPPADENVRSSLTGHFWCTLLVELAHAVETCGAYLDRVPRLAADALLGGGGQTEFANNEVQRRLAGEALGFVWKNANPLLPVDLRHAARLLRVLAVLVCPDPAGHPRLVHLGLMPLAGDVLSSETEARLYRIFGDPADPASLTA